MARRSWTDRDIKKIFHAKRIGYSIQDIATSGIFKGRTYKSISMQYERHFNMYAHNTSIDILTDSEKKKLMKAKTSNLKTYSTRGRKSVFSERQIEIIKYMANKGCSLSDLLACNADDFNDKTIEQIKNKFYDLKYVVRLENIALHKQTQQEIAQ